MPKIQYIDDGRDATDDAAIRALQRVLETTPKADRGKKKKEKVERHYGPGKHPGTGTEQQVHAGKLGKVGAVPKTKSPSAGGFHKAFEAALKGNKYTDFVTHYNEDELKDMKALILTESGNAGLAIKDHGDGRIEGTALFNQGDPPKTGLRLLEMVVETEGVNYLECMGDYLRDQYKTIGFKVTEAYDFDPDLAPASWNYESFGRPKYYIMRLGD